MRRELNTKDIFPLFSRRPAVSYCYSVIIIGRFNGWPFEGFTPFCFVVGRKGDTLVRTWSSHGVTGCLANYPLCLQVRESNKLTCLTRVSKIALCLCSVCLCGLMEVIGSGRSAKVAMVSCQERTCVGVTIKLLVPLQPLLYKEQSTLSPDSVRAAGYILTE